MCTSRLQLETLQLLCLFVLIEFCFSTFLFALPNWLGVVELLVGFCSRSSDFVTSTVGLDSSLFHCPGRRTKCNGCSPCVSQRKFYTAQVVLSGYKICPDTSFMQFAFVTVYPFCCTYRYINYSVRNFSPILIFSTINLNCIATDHTIRDLFTYISSIRWKK